MPDLQTFKLNGKTAYVIMCFEYNENDYCIYAISNETNNYDICYGKVINKVLVPCDPEEKEMISQITKYYVEDFKGRVK